MAGLNCLDLGKLHIVLCIIVISCIYYNTALVYTGDSVFTNEPKYIDETVKTLLLSIYTKFGKTRKSCIKHVHY